MVILPAIDLLDGKVVRLTQGKRDQVTIYSDDPVGMAKHWQSLGATWLHVVDLNGAFDGTYVNLPIAERIMQETTLQVELSGGIRTKETLARGIAAGAARIVLGTKACEDPAFVQEAADRYGRKIAVAIDAKAGQIVSRGWVAPTGLTAKQLARSVLMLGVEYLVCTDVSRDGTLQGPNVGLLDEVLSLGQAKVIASGGISALEDLKNLALRESEGVVGAIIGKALYENEIKLEDALKIGTES